VKVGLLGEADLARRLRGPGLDLGLGPFVVRVRSEFPELARWLLRLYAEQPVSPSEFVDFHVRLQGTGILRRFVKPQAVFSVDGVTPFHPLPRAQLGPCFEWGLNWCIATRAHQFLIFHSAVLERDGSAVVLPGEPGAGKSTLCAALAHRGWRLLSDELGLLDPSSGLLHGLARPVNLKNASIGVIRAFASNAVMSDTCDNTVKGSVALAAPPADSVHRVAEPARPRWVVTPEYARGSAAQMQSHSKATTFMELAYNSFNYSILGESGFDALGQMVDGCECFHFRYSSLHDAVRSFDELSAHG
jgi:HprK-related kinase A